MPPLTATPSTPLRRRAWVAGVSALAAPGVWAACQPVRIPVAPGGLLVRVENGRPQGVVVELIAALRQRLPCGVVSALLPQGRLIQSFYETHEADVLIPGSAVAYEGHVPHFVPLFHVSAHLVGRAAARFGAAGVAALLAQSWRCALVRTVTYGPEFAALIGQLDTQGRVTWVRDVGTALRMVLAERVDFTLLSPTVVFNDVGPVAYRQLQLLPVPGLRPLETGAAVSRRALPEAAQVQVVQALQALAPSGAVGRAFARHFPPEVLAQEFAALPRALRPVLPPLAQPAQGQPRGPA
jgi:polar amino acid transport system substrate-binding protein